jgi:alkanesulfonate monooxygenase SsuD/methylene tetrahydromethanopterin reductase-like flavin-dependent oxidoreductase (luciferase family)
MGQSSGQTDGPLLSGLRDDRSALKLGVFASNLSGGVSISTVERRDEFGWNVGGGAPVLADRLGWDFCLPIARWRGYHGSSDVHDSSFETLTWAAAVAAETEQITVGATAHLAVRPPAFVATAGATVDHGSNGRVALNTVMGWFEPEMEMFGIKLKGHDVRYQHGAEWLTVLLRLWGEDGPFDFDGEWVHAVGVESNPKPKQRPLLFNAGTSPAGVDFCARFCDFSLASVPDPEQAKVTARQIREHAAREYGRTVGSLNVCFVVCAETEAEAKRRLRRIVEGGDPEGANNLLHYLGINSESFANVDALLELFMSTGGATALIGTPEQIAERLIDLSAGGIDGVALTFLDYLYEIEQFDREVVPLLRDAGVRG